jgi:hypothetical protein
MAEHSHIGASSLYRWSKCPGSVNLCKGIKSQSSSYAEEGTLAHEFAAHLLSEAPSKPFPKPVTDEMIEAVDVYIETVLEDYNAVETGAQMLVEHRFDLGKIHPGLFGTADAIIYDPNEKLLRVYDYKHGAGIPVEVENNSQLLYYGLGALLTTTFRASHVELVIVQPRCPHPGGEIRRWRFDALTLIDFSADLKDFAMATEAFNPQLVPGDHCRFCPGAGICPALQEKALTVAKEEFRNDLSYDPKKLSECLTWLPALEGWIKNVREFAYQEAQHGRIAPGFKLVEKRATRKWRYPEIKVAQDLEEIVDGVESIWERKLKSPAQMEKLIPKAKRKEFGDLWIQESSGSTLVPENDKRPSIKDGAKSDFEDVTEPQP